MSTPPAAARLFEEERARLMGVAYRMLGSVSEAEDVLQDVFERWLAADRSEVDNPAAYLTTMTTRRSIDQLRSARKAREVYVGPWLPEPVLTLPGLDGVFGAGPGPADGTWAPAGGSAGGGLGQLGGDPAAVAELDESLTIGYLHLLEQLNPTERAVHLLHEVFDFPYREISGMVGKDEAHCRQISSRARAKLKASRPERMTAPAPEVESEIGAALLTAVLSGEIQQVMDLMTDDVVHLSDGGPDHRAARHPIVGPERVARLLVNLAARVPFDDADRAVEIVPIRANLQPGFILMIDGTPITVMVIEVAGELVRRVHAVVNPDKLSPVMTQLAAWNEAGEG